MTEEVKTSCVSLRAEYDRDGFVIVRGFLSDAEAQ